MRELLVVALLFMVAVILGELLVVMDERLQLQRQFESLVQVGNSFANSQ